ncbi:MAG: dithiol-disulfide isomerase [Rhodospirillaceae bacterium]|nr:dithiol-disulfide isomerase [Rhodospirillaceae bacterium]
MSDRLEHGEIDGEAGNTSSADDGTHDRLAGKTINVEIYADIICPWCYIGKRRLEDAFSKRPDITPVYQWRAFLLNPTMPRDGMNRNAYLHAKFGHSAAAVYGRIATAGLDSGISFRFDDIRRTPDSRAAHRLLIAAGSENAMLSETLYRAYFIDGRDIGDMSVLAEIADASGQPDLLEKAADDAVGRQLENNLATANQLRLDGVPFFIFDGKYAIAGAHQPEHLIPAIDAAAAA